MRHNLQSLNCDLKSFKHEGMRYYIIPNSYIAVPSVTSVLYKNEIFDDNDPRVIKSRIRGNVIHNLLEDYCKNGVIPKFQTPIDMENFYKFKTVLDENLEEVNYVEQTVFDSSRLMTAGRLDLAGIWKGRGAIIDFKNVNYKKKEKWLENYFLQLTAYSVMLSRMTTIPNLNFRKLVLIVSPDNEPIQIFEKDVTEFIHLLQQKFIIERKLNL